MNNYFIKCRDVKLRKHIGDLSEQYGDEATLNIILKELDIEIKGHLMVRVNNLSNNDKFYISYSKLYTRGDIGVSQCGIEIMKNEGRS